MSTVQEDPLYQVFEEHLHSGLYDGLPIEQLVSDVVEFYLRTLSRAGHIPHHLQGPLKTDLSQDVKDMLKLKTYGHFGVGEYNRTRLKKSS